MEFLHLIIDLLIIVLTIGVIIMTGLVVWSVCELRRRS